MQLSKRTMNWACASTSTDTTQCSPSPARAVAAFLALALAIGSLVGCGGESDGQGYGLEQDSETLQVGFITVGTTSDWGWNYQHDQGRRYLQGSMPDRVNTVIVENIPENADAQRVMNRMANEGTDVIFSTSYGYADFLDRAAKNNPNVIFMQALAPVNSLNAATYSAAIWEAAYVAGIVSAITAGNETRFGFVAAHPIPPVNWTVNAFILGARTVNPEIIVDIVYTNSWHDPAAETEAVNSLASRGVKLVYPLVDSSLAAVRAAERAGVYSVSHNADLSQFAPEYYVTGVVWNWGAIYEDVANRVIAGTFGPEDVSGGFKEGYVALAPYGPNVPSDASEKAEAVARQIGTGEVDVFAGPIYDNGGKLRVPKGESLSVQEIASMEWLADGVRSAR